ncbi:Amidohydrolase [Rubripirellula amarantea]|uniref:Amidohydrolase n=1 Tax=Rubripirellula amarantea TaxID=2527999 RepID=A0A5C5WLE9_9BACT|nr:amidohydrolase family protein [Rubripirellula amarantea]TWT50592.1 Amidohydrolase [Rubripirellula amarantea]
MLIDSHHHLWKYSVEEYGWIGPGMEVLQKDFLAAELREVSAANGVTGFVSVQARQVIEETTALIEIAANEPLIKGVVGWVPLAEANVGEVLDRFADSKSKILKGVRHVIQGEPVEAQLLNKDFNRGVAQLADRGLVYDVLIFANQLPATIEFVRHHAGIPMVLDHIGKPTIKSGKLDTEWEQGFRELAKEQHLMCKFSGVATEVKDATWSIETIKPYFAIALDAFGIDRLMFGSDWPVCLLKTGYDRWLATVRELAADLSADEQQKLFAGNATRAYNLA